MNICPKCGNENVQVYYVTGNNPDTGEKYCDVCVLERANKSFFSKLKDAVLGNKK